MNEDNIECRGYQFCNRRLSELELLQFKARAKLSEIANIRMQAIEAAIKQSNSYRRCFY